MTEKIFTTATLSEYLGTSRFFVTDHTRGSNPIPSYRIGGNRLLRFKESEVLVWLESNRNKKA